MRKIALGVLGGFGALVIACGGSDPAPAAPSAPSAPSAPAASAPATPAAPAAPATPAAPAAPSPTPAASAAPAAAPATPAAEAAYTDPNEHPDGFLLTPLFTKKTKPSSFPKKSAKDGECWTTVGITGDHGKDFPALLAACGTPTGLVEYVKPMEGKLHSKHDPRDVYKIPLVGGYCYRYFAVADSGISDLDLLIQKPGGALVGDDQTTSPVAIIESDKPWCVDEDQTLEFHVKVDGPGSGGYAFGIWARPGK